MFILADEQEAKIVRKWPVVIQVPQDGGQVTKSEIECDFMILPQDEMDALIQSSREGDGDEDVLRRVWVGFGRVQDAAGNPIEYSDAVRDRMLKIPYVRGAILRGYFVTACRVVRSREMKNGH